MLPLLPTPRCCVCQWIGGDRYHRGAATAPQLFSGVGLVNAAPAVAIADAEVFAAVLGERCGARLAVSPTTCRLLSLALPVFGCCQPLPQLSAVACATTSRQLSDYLKRAGGRISCLVSVDILEMCVEPQTQCVALLLGANKQRSWRKAAHKCGGKASSCCWPWPGL